MPIVSMQTAETADVKSKNGILSDSWVRGVRTKARELARRSDEIFLELGKILYVVWDTPADGTFAGSALYERWGYTSFAEWVEADLGMDAQRAIRLRKIWYTLEIDCKGISDELKQNLVDLGSTKLRDLAPVLCTANAQAWYDLVKDKSVQEVRSFVDDSIRQAKLEEAKEEIARLRLERSTETDRVPIREPDPTPEPEEAAPTPVVPEPETDIGSLLNENFKLYPLQRQSLYEALDAAKSLTSSPNAKKGHLLDLICIDFLATNDIRSKDPDRSRVDFIRKFETRLGVRIIAIEPKSGEIITGMDVLESLAKR